ncbi:MAG: hypothetical protein JKY37_17990 [Nannocystaceae bacterium]|nr:hypothetical protein [Nannocystaceae bacterium]
MIRATAAAMLLSFVGLMSAGQEGFIAFIPLALVLLFHARAAERAVATIAAAQAWKESPRVWPMWALCCASAVATWSAMPALVRSENGLLLMCGLAALALPLAAACSQWKCSGRAAALRSPLLVQATLASLSLAMAISVTGHLLMFMIGNVLLTTEGILFAIGLLCLVALRLATDRDAEPAAHRLAIGLTGLLGAIAGLRGQVGDGAVLLVVTAVLSIGARHRGTGLVFFGAASVLMGIGGVLAPEATDRVALGAAGLVLGIAGLYRPSATIPQPDGA